MSSLQLRRRTIVAAALGLGSVFSTASEARKKPAPPAKKAVTPLDDNAPDIVTYGRRDDVLRFADGVAERQGLDLAWLLASLQDARFIPSVTRYIMPPVVGAKKNWAAYRARFVEPIRLRAGAAFWDANARWLAQADEVYGVPPEVIVGVVGVESIYGRQMGNFRIIDALATLSFDFPPGRKDRSDFFKSELEAWFVLCKSEGVDPLAWRGSYAGAIGMAQFMPSSFNKYAVDFDGDGRVDLHASAADAIGSVANYLAEFGWKRGLPARFEVQPPADAAQRDELLAADITPTFSGAEMAAHGARLPDAASGVDSLLALIELQNGDAAPTYIAGTSNFYSLTRYNWSSYYAMAVLALGETVAATRGRG